MVQDHLREWFQRCPLFTRPQCQSMIPPRDPAANQLIIMQSIVAPTGSDQELATWNQGELHRELGQPSLSHAIFTVIAKPQILYSLFFFHCYCKTLDIFLVAPSCILTTRYFKTFISVSLHRASVLRSHSSGAQRILWYWDQTRRWLHLRQMPTLSLYCCTRILK